VQWPARIMILVMTAYTLRLVAFPEQWYQVRGWPGPTGYDSPMHSFLTQCPPLPLQPSKFTYANQACVSDAAQQGRGHRVSDDNNPGELDHDFGTPLCCSKTLAAREADESRCALPTFSRQEAGKDDMHGEKQPGCFSRLSKFVLLFF
jgi:hypothetical protein